MKIFNAHKKKNEAVAALKDVSGLANFVAEELKKETDTFSDVKVIDGKFVWFNIADQTLNGTVKSILKDGVTIDHDLNKQVICVDFSSPNVAKEMHVGHLRSTIIGDAFCRIFEYFGNDVRRINHLGDWGTQFGMLICHLFESYPNWEADMPDISDLENFYREAKKRFTNEEDFKTRSRETVVKLQGGDENCRKAWKAICDTSKVCFEKIYERLDIKIGHFGESYYNDMIPATLDELIEKGLTKEDAGALCMFIPKKKVPLMVRKSDGAFNYDTTDMAAIRHRIMDLKANRIVYVTDMGQWSHFDLVFRGAELAKWYDPKVQKVEHAGFGIVLGEDGKRMQTRDGKTVKLMLLLDEAKGRARKALEDRFSAKKEDQENKKEDEENKIEEGKEEVVRTKLSEEEFEAAAEKMGIAAIKYFDLRQNRTQDYKFDFDNMLNPKGDTSVYLLFSYARICSVINKSGISQQELEENADSFVFTHDHEKT